MLSRASTAAVLPTTRIVELYCWMSAWPLAAAVWTKVL